MKMKNSIRDTPILDEQSVRDYVADIQKAAHDFLAQDPAAPYSQLLAHVMQQPSIIEFNQALLEQAQKVRTACCAKPAKVENISVAILGAGQAGLLAAFLLAKNGFTVSVYEKREEALSKLRPQNISYKQSEEILRPMLGEEGYQKFFTAGGVLDGNTGKLRLTIGAFQEVLCELAQAHGAQIHYGEDLSPAECVEKSNADFLIVTTGAHTCQRYGFDDLYSAVYFPDFDVEIHTALYLQEGEGEFGYHRHEREGYDWRRVNITNFSGATFTPDINRILKNPLTKDDCKERLEQLKQADNVFYAFNFGNATDKFQDSPDVEYQHEPVQETTCSIKPMLTRRLVQTIDGIPTILLGDSNGTAHPLAAIGTLKFLINVSLLSDCLSHGVSNPSCQQHFLQCYEAQAMVNTLQVFRENILCSMFSRKR